MADSSTSSSSAPAPAATSPRSAPRSSASRRRASTTGQRADGKPAPGGTCTNVGCIPSQGAAAVVRELRARRPRVRRARHRRQGPVDRRRADARAQGQGRRAEQRRHPVPLQEEQDHVPPRPRRVRGGKASDGWKRRRWRAPGRPSSSAKHVIVATGSHAARAAGRRDRQRAACSTTRARSRSRRCRSGSASSAPA